MTFTHHDGTATTVYKGFNALVSPPKQMKSGLLLAVVSWEGEDSFYVCNNNKLARVNLRAFIKERCGDDAWVRFLLID